MGRAPVIYTEPAYADIDRAYDAVYQLSLSVATADRYIARLYERISRIGDVPLGGRPRDDIAEGLRTVPFEKSAVIAYRVVAGNVEITSIFYAGEDYESVLRGERERYEH